ncbi:class I SAM-dependent methyltransferase [Kitasatospora sp. RB6PN24]|uniref:class I SAM-dependent methyltransferase n=1 Tax=Kitasatospora humi TaxID=2893891 RepID=UPI001E38BE59|nr:class I SAM-dependent methyltransferase [Kitasatospora humi]MCC9312254.1 class I SAM-dependent methyltransferase [Kitasatospora humi]
MVTTDTRPVDQAPLPRTLDDVPGWFWPIDQQLFTWLLERQSASGTSGDLLELGSYLGRSAILIGRHLRAGETFTVCDLFDSEAPDGDNAAEMTMSYRQTLTRTAFERNYLAFHSKLPTIVQAPTSVLEDGRIAAGSCRFVHIDASHLYEHVSIDIRTAKAVLGPDGIVVLDDFRSPHTPGVAAATWEAVFQQALRPICVTPEKLYGTWGDPEPVQKALVELDGDAADCHLDIDVIAGRRLIRLSGRGVAKLLPADERKQSAAPGSPPAPGRPQAQRPSSARRLARDLLPPLAVRAVRKMRARSSG